MSDLLSIIDFSFKNPTIFVFLVIIVILIWVSIGIYDKRNNKQKEIQQKQQDDKELLKEEITALEKIIMSKVEETKEIAVKANRKVDDHIENNNKKYDQLIEIVKELKNSVDSITECFFDFVELSSLNKENSSKIMRKLKP